MRIISDRDMIPTSYVLYTIGTVGSGAGVFATLTGLNLTSVIDANIGPAVLFLSIAVLWIGLWHESVEQSIE